MKECKTDFLIIGAGLSGLTSAYYLKKNGIDNFMIVESRNRIGGRILTRNAVDFGAAWFQNHHTNVVKLLDDLSIQKFHQYVKGTSVLVYNSMAPSHLFESDTSVPSAYRIGGGSIRMINTLAQPFLDKIQLSQNVLNILEVENGLVVTTPEMEILTQKVICTIPPRIAARIKYEPELPEFVEAAMQRTHTWMSNAMKVGLTFECPFWRDKGFSGTIIGQVGAVTELYDHTNESENKFSLMGFINEGLRDLESDKRKERILSYLNKHLGEEVLNYVTYDEKDWSSDRHTSCETIKSVYLSPEYGNPVFQKRYMNDRLVFSGSETATEFGGYMDGAIMRGQQVVEQFLK
ncbi:FAD-dependent oxidoreductase [Spongiivirga sp. MCCC 1A20706]|uniref:flavin monoamine oxidase family protein n=1 Tax=Spongiivirga sp. MCCC 1A20706 TaxID=3160963 RepID=UPI00397774FC